MKLAAVTMVYNEAEYLPVWLRHYGAAIGIAHCHVVDHGSTDGSTEHLGGANRLRLPRSPHDDARRSAFMSCYCASLLHWYDAVIHSDVDELLVATPSLAAYAATMPDDVATAIGFNLLHLSGEQPPLDRACPIGAQRPWAWFTSAMCKPALIRRPVAWSPGFHCADAPLRFGGLYLLHLRYADRAIARARLARTRGMAWANLEAGAHQRMSDADFAAMLDRLERMDRRTDVDFDPARPPLADSLAAVAASQVGREEAVYRIALDIDRYELWRIPPALCDAF